MRALEHVRGGSGDRASRRDSRQCRQSSRGARRGRGGDQAIRRSGATPEIDGGKAGRHGTTSSYVTEVPKPPFPTLVAQDETSSRLLTRFPHPDCLPGSIGQGEVPSLRSPCAPTITASVSKPVLPFQREAVKQLESHRCGAAPRFARLSRLHPTPDRCCSQPKTRKSDCRRVWTVRYRLIAGPARRADRP